MSAGALRGGPAHLILIGLPGAGKTTHGRRVAKALARPFVDLDRRVALLAGKSVTQIFEDDGEVAFRALERTATAELATETASIVSPGGGWMLDPINTELVKPASIIVWLQVAPKTAVERMGARIALRPLLASGDPVARLAELLAQRAPRYATAHAVIDTEALDWQGVADAIASLAPPSSAG